MKYIQKNTSIKNYKKILANFDDEVIRVYQAYNNQIVDEAIRLGTFNDRMLPTEKEYILKEDRI